MSQERPCRRVLINLQHGYEEPLHIGIIVGLRVGGEWPEHRIGATNDGRRQAEEFVQRQGHTRRAISLAKTEGRVDGFDNEEVAHGKALIRRFGAELSSIVGKPLVAVRKAIETGRCPRPDSLIGRGRCLCSRYAGEADRTGDLFIELPVVFR